jgi:hypothetical protein
VDPERARHAVLNGAVFDEPLPPVDFKGLIRSVLLRKWQGKWNAADTDSFAHTSYSQRFLFALGLKIKGRTENLFPLCRE